MNGHELLRAHVAVEPANDALQEDDFKLKIFNVGDELQARAANAERLRPLRGIQLYSYALLLLCTLIIVANLAIVPFEFLPSDVAISR